MKALLFGALLSFQIFATTNIEFERTNIEIATYQKAIVELTFTEISEKEYVPTLKAKYLWGINNEFFTEYFPLPLVDHTVIKSGKFLYIIDENGDDLIIARIKGGLFGKRYILDPYFTFKVEQDLTSGYLVLRPTLTKVQ